MPNAPRKGLTLIKCDASDKKGCPSAAGQEAGREELSRGPISVPVRDDCLLDGVSATSDLILKV